MAGCRILPAQADEQRSYGTMADNDGLNFPSKANSIQHDHAPQQ